MDQMTLIILACICSFLFGWKASKAYFMVNKTTAVLRIMAGVMSGEMSNEQARKEMDKINLD